MKNLIFMSLISLFGIFLVGCASIVSKSQYPVTFNSSPCAKIKITDLHKGDIIYEGKTPTTITLKAKAGFFSPARYNVDFLFPNGVTRQVTLSATLDGWYIGNILFGGLIGMLIVDPATGAMWKLPPDVKVKLPQKTSKIIFNGKVLEVAMKTNIPKCIDPYLKRIK